MRPHDDFEKQDEWLTLIWELVLFIIESGNL